jgi:hypothetical protein
MKKSLWALALLGLTATLSYADITAKLYLSGSLDDNLANGLLLNNQDQQYNSPGMVHVSSDGKNAGFAFNLYTGALSDATPVKVQKLSAWLRPFPTLKVSVGGVGLYTYTEQINWWKDPNGASLANAGFDNNVGSDSSPGVAAEWTGIPALTLSAIAAPGYGTGLGAGQGANLKGGASAKYDLKGFGSVGAGLRYDGKGNPALVHAGADFNAVPGLYTFLDLVARTDNNTKPGLDALAFDWYAKYSLKALTVQAAVPVTLRLTGLTGDVNYLSYDLKVAYDLPTLKLTPFVQAQQDHLNLSTDKFLPQVNLGTSFNGFDSATLDCSFQYTVVDGGANTWSIPFNVNLWF